MNELLARRIRQCPSLPSLPAIALQVIQLVQKDDVDIAEIARVISKDPALSSKILRTVNSAFYGRGHSISTISHALVILGLQAVKTLVLGFSLVNGLNPAKGKGFRHFAYWRRSVYAAVAARTLAARLDIIQQEECFLAALLADIGVLVLYQVLGEQYGQVHSQAATHSQLEEVERQFLGMTHADATRILAEQWKLPPVLSIPMAFHHAPDQVDDSSLRSLTKVVWLSGHCADVFVESQAAEPIALVRRFCLENHQMPEPECDAMLEEICRRTREVAPLFEISLGDDTTYEAILKKANEALVEITLRTQQQAATLQRINLQLKEQATTDSLTGLANRASFDRFIGEQFEAALLACRPMAVLLLDLDHFKRVNDTYGHQVGDHALETVARTLKSACRAGDLAARYGGEEMALIMPGTTRATAAAIAESIRRAIASKPVRCADAAIPITVSIGVACHEPGGPFREAAHLIRAADLAVYAAKNAGRNCVKVFSLRSASAA